METTKTGRPTKYDPAFIGEAIEFLAEGYSVTAFAGHIGVARSTIYKWADEHPEFSDALKAGQAKTALWWETVGRSLAVSGEGNATMIVFALKNMASDDWRDKRELEHSGPDGGPIQTAALTPEQLEEELRRRGLPARVFSE